MLGALAVVGGCVDRLLVPIACDDGELVRGEACFSGDHEQLELGFEPLALRTAEFDRNGVPEVLITGLDAAGVVVGALSRADDSGHLAPPELAAVYGCSAYPAVGEANGDGVADLLVDACDDTMLVFVGNGDGSFAVPITVDLDVATLTSALVDVDVDGNNDVIALGIAGTSIAVTWTKHDGNGGYAAPVGTFVGVLDAGDAPRSFSVGQLDGDGLPDLVLSHGDPSHPPMVAFGTGDAFREPVPWDALGIATGVALIDTDDDGDAEILVVRDDPPALEVWRGDFASARRSATTKMPQLATHVLASGDIDGDGTLDLGLFETDAADISLWLADGQDGWQRTTEVNVGAAVNQLSIADLDGDGAAELVAGTFARRTITVVHSAP